MAGLKIRSAAFSGGVLSFLKKRRFLRQAK